MPPMTDDERRELARIEFGNAMADAQEHRGLAQLLDTRLSDLGVARILSYRAPGPHGPWHLQAFDANHKSLAQVNTTDTLLGALGTLLETVSAARVKRPAP